MKKFIVFLCLSYLLTPLDSIAQGQLESTKGNLDLAAQHLELGNYKAAVKEYLRIHFYDRTGEYNYLSAQIAYCFELLGDYENAKRYTSKYLRTAGLSMDQIADASYHQVQLTLKQNEALAKVELFQFSDELIEHDSDRYHYHLVMTQLLSDDYKEGYRTIKALSYYDALPLVELIQIYKDLEANLQKNHGMARFLSTLVPGLGQTVNGDAQDGLNSLLINAVMVAFFINLQMNLSTADAVLTALPWFGRFYVGGMRNAMGASRKKQAQVKKELLSELNQLLKTAKHNSF